MSRTHNHDNKKSIFLVEDNHEGDQSKENLALKIKAQSRPESISSISSSIKSKSKDKIVKRLKRPTLQKKDSEYIPSSVKKSIKRMR